MRALNILVADDNVDFYSLLKLRIESLEYETNLIHANNGYEALSIIREKKIDLLITDFSMPVINGIELIKSLKTLDKSHLPKEVVILSAYIEDGPPPKGLESVKFLPKDDFYEDLVYIITDLCESLENEDEDSHLSIRDVRVDIIGSKFVDIVHAVDLDLYGVTVHDPHLIFDCEKDEVVDCIISLPNQQDLKIKGRVKRQLGLSEKYFKIEFFDLNRVNQRALEGFLHEGEAA
ncbi:response regulator [Halobacteriovorax sp.]|uniref:response regulator n=1 Tax=Halobacteriovorax sp. TaxID=2020862 RepID=UPI00356918CC